jgi:hypothetical protein
MGRPSCRGFDGNDRTSLSTCYLRNGWDALEAGADERAGQKIATGTDSFIALETFVTVVYPKRVIAF